MTQCSEHSGVQRQLNNHEGRIRGLEDTMIDVQKLTVKLDTMIDQLNKMYWIMVTAVAGSLVAAIMALILK